LDEASAEIETVVKFDLSAEQPSRLVVHAQRLFARNTECRAKPVTVSHVHPKQFLELKQLFQRLLAIWTAAKPLRRDKTALLLGALGRLRDISLCGG
jgi:hypothetical protein